MNKNNNVYCRFENFCCHFLQDEATAAKEKSLYLPIEDVYVEYFTDIASLKIRIFELYKIWMNQHGYNNRSEETYDYPGFIIFNQYGDSSVVGYCPLGWHFFNGGFTNYICQYVIALGIDKYPQNIRKIQGHGFDFDVSVEHMDYEMNLLSDKLMDLELEHFLEGKEITEKIEQEVFYPEMVRRGYIDILNEK